MHFPLNQLFSLSVSLPLSYSLFPLAKRISFRSPTRLTTSHRNLLRLRTLICMLSFSFCSTLSLPIFRQFPSVLAIPARISLCSAYYAVLLCTCVARFGGIRNQKKNKKKWLRLRSFRLCRYTCKQLGLPHPAFCKPPAACLVVAHCVSTSPEIAFDLQTIISTASQTDPANCSISELACCQASSN